MTHKKVIVLAFNAKLADGCDYAIQSLLWLGKQAKTYGLVLGEPIRWLDIFQRPVVEHAHNVTLLRPLFVFPGLRIPLIKQINYFLFLSFVYVYVALRYRHIFRKILWVFEPDNITPFLWIFRQFTIVYDSIDYQGSRSKELDRQEKKLLHCANLITCVSRTLTERYQQVKKDAIFVPLGFNPKMFPTVRKLIPGKHHNFTVGFIGGINNRMDFPLLQEAIRALPDFRFLFVGPIQQSEDFCGSSIWEKTRRLFAHPNVVYAGAVPKDHVHTYLSSIDVGIIPYDISLPFNSYCHPMKLLDYFWFGKPVVATAIPELFRYRSLVAVARNSKDFVNKLKQSQLRQWPARLRRAQRNVAFRNTCEKKLP